MNANLGMMRTKETIEKAQRIIKSWLSKIRVNELSIIMQYDTQLNIAILKFTYNQKDYEFRSTKQANYRLNMHGIARVIEYKVRSQIMGIEDFEKSMTAYLSLPNYTNQRQENTISINEDAYRELEINSNATNEEIRAKYLELMKTFHPDNALSEGAKKEFEIKATKINQAYSKIKEQRGI